MQNSSNQCLYCRGKGVVEYWEIDGQTIYSWQKPKQKPCEHCGGKHARRN